MCRYVVTVGGSQKFILILIVSYYINSPSSHWVKMTQN